MFIIHLPTRKRNRQERSLTILRYGNVENSRSADGKQTFTARWKPQPANIVSHSSASMTVYTHEQVRVHDVRGMAFGVLGFPLVVLAAKSNVPLAAVPVIYTNVHFCTAVFTEM